MGKQAVAECDSGIRRLDQLRQDVRKRQAEADQYLRDRVAEWAVDACERIAKETRDGAQQLLENALRNKNANSKVIAATLYQSTK